MLQLLISKLKMLQKIFYDRYEVNDIYSNSKIYEVLIANRFSHQLIPGHSGSRDAIDQEGNEIEYKHFKESSSNHTWTFNDFSNTTLEKLKLTPFVFFTYIDDVNYSFPGQVKWVYVLEGHVVSEFLELATQRISNKRKMINVSQNNLRSMGYERTILPNFDLIDGIYGIELAEIINVIKSIETLTETKGLLTSNKLWELLVAAELQHNINSEQGGRAGAHDAFDEHGNLFEYKVSKNHSWQFQDISENVLLKYLEDDAIILAVVDKLNMKVTHIYSAQPDKVVDLLEDKLNKRIIMAASTGREIRRLQVSLTKMDLVKIEASLVYCSQ